MASGTHGDGGWANLANADESNSFRGRKPRSRKATYSSRGGDHYSPTRTSPRSLSPITRRPPSPQNVGRGLNNNYVSAQRPVLHITTTSVSMARTPSPRQLSPLSAWSPQPGQKRRRGGNEPNYRYRPADREFARSHSARTPPPVRSNRRSLSPDRFGGVGLQSRIGVRDADFSSSRGQSYRPSYPSDSYYPPSTRRVSDSYQPVEHTGFEQDFESSRNSRARYDSYDYPPQSEAPERPDLLERMSAGPTSTRGRGAGPARGTNRGRGGRGGAKPLEQRISNSSNKSMTLMKRLEG